MNSAAQGVAFPDALAHQLGELGVIAVLVIDRSEDAGPVAEALYSGGVRAIELTLRTAVALQCIEQIRTAVPDMLVGAGTVLSAAQVQQVADAGATFGVAPGTNASTIQAAGRVGLPFAPGVCTPTDIELAVQQGCKLLKFFPCGPSGGLPYLRSIAAPFEHLGVSFIPLGGIDSANAQAYLREKLVRAIGGSWLAPRALIQSGQWQQIEANAAAAMKLVSQLRRGDSQEVDR